MRLRVIKQTEDAMEGKRERRNEQRDQVFFPSRYGPRTGAKSAFRPGWTNIELLHESSG